MQNCSNVDVSLLKDVSFPSLKNVASFANRVCLMVLFFILRPVISGHFAIKLDSISIQIKNKNEDKGHPCLTPRLIEKLSDKCPLFIITPFMPV